MKFLQKFFEVDPERDAAEKLYAQLVSQSRQPAFYLDGGVADSVDGRFDLLVLNAVLVMRRLSDNADQTKTFSQSLFDVMFENLDEALREIGIGDLSVGGKIKSMAEAFYGRVASYNDALADPADDSLKEALRRNLYRKNTSFEDRQLDLVADYVRRQMEHLERQALPVILQGEVSFVPLDKESVRVP